MLIYWNIVIWNTNILTFKTVCKVSKSLTILILRKKEIPIEFNGNFGNLCGVITH